MDQLLFVHAHLAGVLEDSDLGQHAEHLVDGADLAHLAKLVAEVRQREGIGLEFSMNLERLLLVDSLLGLLDQGEHVAHTEDA